MKTNFLKVAALGVITSFLFSGCATIFGRSSYPVSINTNPPGAAVSITNKKNKEVYKGTTPTTVRLKSHAGYFTRAEYQVKLSSPGYEEQIVPVYYKLNGWYFGNLLHGGLIGMLIIDPATGAMWKLDTPPINITLNQSSFTLTQPKLKTLDIKEVPPSMKGNLVKLK
ncbi:MAG TPA: PEGA domain-containing protein [Hanamia sp.]|nr:PEGA domain-containing protein [Hanamia sp.]